MIKEKIINNERYRHTGLANYWVSEYGNIINFNMNSNIYLEKQKELKNLTN